MIQAICKALMHSLWQGLLFSFVTGLFLLYARRLTAAVRYLVLSGLFFALLATCGATLLWELYSLGDDPDGYAAVEGGGRVLLPLWNSLNAFCTEHAAAIVLVWFLVFLFRSLQMAAGLAFSHRIKHSMTETAPLYWRKKIRQLSRHLKIKKNVRLLESGIVNMPLVIGHLRPVIFIPLGLLTQLPEREIEAVLLHELAHIRRHDYIVNFVQQIAGNLLFFNPGVLWISALVREERENCCDDIAIGYTGDKANFIRALVSFKQHTGVTGGLAVAFPSRRHQLLQRVLRIAHDRNKSLNTSEKWFFIGSCLVMAALLTSLNNPGLLLTKASAAKHPPVISVQGPVNPQRGLPTVMPESSMHIPGSAMVTPGSPGETQASGRETVGRPSAENGSTTIGQETDINADLSTTRTGQMEGNKEQADANADLLAALRERMTAAERGPLDAKLLAERAARQNEIERAQHQEDVIRTEENFQRLEQDLKTKQDKLAADMANLEAIKRQIEQANADSRQQEQLLRQRGPDGKSRDQKDKEQGKIDNIQTERDKEQALRDKAQAAIDQLQAGSDRLQMLKDQQSAEKHRPRSEQKN